MYSSEHIITSKHYLILCVCAFCAGILFSVRYPAYCQTVKYAAYIICAVLAATVFLVLIFKKRSRRIKPFLLPLLLTAFVLLGILRCESFDNRRTVLDNCAGKLTWFYGRVVSPPSLSSNGQYCRFELNVRAVELSGFTAKTDEDIVLTAPPSLGRAYLNQFQRLVRFRILREIPEKQKYFLYRKGENPARKRTSAGALLCF